MGVDHSAATANSNEVVNILSATPKEIARLIRGCSDQQLHRAPTTDAWSVHEIVAHLRACAEVWGQSIGRMLAEDNPSIRYVSPRSWIKKTDFLDQGFGDSLQAFTSARFVLLASLMSLDAKDWSRAATFTGTTAGRNASVLQYAKRIADHELRHLDQIRRTVVLVK